MSAVEVPFGRPCYSFNAKHPPVVWVEAGTRLRFQTSDDSYHAMSGELIDSGRVDFHKVNALVGPVGIRGASPGDALGVTIEAIHVGTRAFMVYPARWRNRTFGIAVSEVSELAIEDGYVALPDGGRIAAQPMIGCIGVAPRSGSVSALNPASTTGGNMDLVEASAGATLWFPVQVDGAMLSLGDVHVRMGRGEAVGSGLECAGEVLATVQIAKNVELRGPIVIDPTYIHFVGTHPDDSAEAERIAVGAAWHWLSSDEDLLQSTRFSICAALLDINFGGPAGANVIARFSLKGLTLAGVSSTLWPLRSS